MVFKGCVYYVVYGLWYTPSTADIQLCEPCCHLHTYRLYMRAHTHSKATSSVCNSRCSLVCFAYVLQFCFCQHRYTGCVCSVTQTYSTVSWEVVKLCIPSRLGPAETACLRNSSLSFMPCSLWTHSLLVIVSWHNAPLIHFDSVCFMFLLSSLSIIYHPTRKKPPNNCGREQRILQRLSSAQLVRGCHLSLKLIHFGTDSCGPQEEDSEWNDLTEKFLSTHYFFWSCGL